MDDAIPWTRFLGRTAVALGLVLAFQYAVRGELEPVVAAVAAAGFFVALVAAHRYARRD